MGAAEQMFGLEAGMAVFMPSLSLNICIYIYAVCIY